jgi:hypothetical protein
MVNNNWEQASDDEIQFVTLCLSVSLSVEPSSCYDDVNIKAVPRKPHWNNPNSSRGTQFDVSDAKLKS